MFKDKTKLIATIVIAALLAFGLSACSSGSSSSGSSQPSSSAAEEKVDPAKDVIGAWQVAAVKMDNVTIVGDFSASYDDYNNMGIEINEDGTGKITAGEEEDKPLTWKAEGDEIVFDIEGIEDAGVEVKYSDGMIVLAGVDETSDNPVNEAYFTKDGTYPELSAISLADAEAVTNKDIAGSYEMCGAGMYEMTVYGDPADIATTMGVPDMEMVLNADGTGTIGGSEEISWLVGSDGAAVSMDMFGEKADVPLKASGDYYLLDVSKLMGSNMYFLYQAKAK